MGCEKVRVYQSLGGPSEAGQSGRTRRNTISFKACDPEVLRVQHPPIWAERRIAKTAAFASVQSSRCNVSSCPARAARSKLGRGAPLAGRSSL